MEKNDLFFELSGDIIQSQDWVIPEGKKRGFFVNSMSSGIIFASGAPRLVGSV
jgi:hypothetical protein